MSKFKKEELKDTEYLIDALCKKYNIPRYEKVFLNDINDYKNEKFIVLSDLYVIHDSITYDIIGGHNIKGGKFVIDTNSGKTFNYNTTFDQSYYKKSKTLEDFEGKFKKCGKRKDYETGGWYGWEEVYELDGIRYSNL